MTRNVLVALTAVLVGSGCVSPGTPVPVRGDIQALAGEWDGSYSSVETGRSGRIVFPLKAGGAGGGALARRWGGGRAPPSGGGLGARARGAPPPGGGRAPPPLWAGRRYS